MAPANYSCPLCVQLTSSSQSYTDVCPVLSPPGSSDSGGYVQPVNVDSPLTVSGSNLPVSTPKLYSMNICYE